MLSNILPWAPVRARLYLGAHCRHDRRRLFHGTAAGAARITSSEELRWL